MNKAIFLLRQHSSYFPSRVLGPWNSAKHLPKSSTTLADRRHTSLWPPVRTQIFASQVAQARRNLSTATNAPSSSSQKQTQASTGSITKLGVCSAAILAVVAAIYFSNSEGRRHSVIKDLLPVSSTTLPESGTESDKRDGTKATHNVNQVMGATDTHSDNEVMGVEEKKASEDVDSYHDAVHAEEHLIYSESEYSKENDAGETQHLEEEVAQAKSTEEHGHAEKSLPTEIDNHLHVDLTTSLPDNSGVEGAGVTVDVANNESSEGNRAEPVGAVQENKEDFSKVSFHELLATESLQEVSGSRKVDNVHSRRPSLSESYFHLKGHEENVKNFEKQKEEETSGDSVSHQSESGREESAWLEIRKGDFGDENTVKRLEKTGSAFNFVEVLHAAEQRQAEVDARIYQEERKKLEDKYQQELKDVQAKEVMFAEEANRLAKELAKEKTRATAALKFQQEEADEKLHRELKLKQEEAEANLSRMQVLWKAEESAATVKEITDNLREIKDLKLQIDALRVAFYARSEEARQSHTVHKLAVGTFAMEDAMMRGAPVEKEVSLLLSSAGGHILDPLLDVALASLPQEAIKEGTRTRSQLHLKFQNLSGALRELSLIPTGGGGLLTHALAKFFSSLKVKGEGEYLDGIEAVICQVERSLSEGKLAEAADVLEKGVRGTKAEDFAAEWVKHARNRAVMEQALSLLQAHATAIASSLA